MKKDEKSKEKAGMTTGLQLIGLAVLNAVHSAYMINYHPKTGAYHVWLCAGIGLLILVFCIWSVIADIRILIAGEGTKGYMITVLALSVLLLVMGGDSTLPYIKDLAGDNRTVTTNRYLVIRDALSFQDNEGNEVTIQIPADKAYELRTRENYEYDQENNLLIYYEPVTITYYPNSKVLLEI